MVSREAAFLYNNLVLCGIAFAVLWGTVFPILSEWARGTKVTVGPPFFNAVNVPLGLLLLALTGIGPLIAWRKASVSNLKRQFARPDALGHRRGRGAARRSACATSYPLMTYALCGFVTGTIVQEFYKGIRARQAIHGESIFTGFMHLVGRNRRRYGGYIVHAGIVMLFAAFAGMAFKSEYDITLQQRRSVRHEGSVRPHLALREPGHVVLRARRSQRHGGEPRGVPRRQAHRHHHEREADVSRHAGQSALHSRSPKSAFARRRSSTRTSCSRAFAARTPPSCASRSTRSWCGCGSAAS